MTDEQKFLFDLNGFLILDGVLPPLQCEKLRRQIARMVHAPEELPPAARTPPGGELAALIDHPAVEDVLGEVIGPHLRLEHCAAIWREKGERHPQDLHMGGPIPDPFFRYNVIGGAIRSTLTRVVFELNDVAEEDGATCFLPGSHKANFPVPESMKSLEPGQQSQFLYRPTCSAGSIIIFSENTAHGGPPWTNPDRPRIAALFAYNHVGMRFHRPTIEPAVLESLTDRQRAYFRDVWVYDSETGGDNRGETGRGLFAPPPGNGGRR